MVVDDDGSFLELYLIHIIDKVLSFVLKELRIATTKNSFEVNRKILKIPYKKFATATVCDGDEIKSEITVACGDNIDHYIRRKQERRSSLGYEDFRYRAAFTLRTNDVPEFVDVMLGLRAGKVEDFKVDELRWGIPISEDTGTGEGSIKLKPGGRRGELIVRRGFDKISQKVEVIIPQIKGLNQKYFKIRISSELLDIIVDLGNHSISFSPKSNEFATLTISQHIRLNETQMMLMSKGTTMELRVKPDVRQSFEVASFDAGLDNEQLETNHNILMRVRNVLQKAGGLDLRLLSSDIAQQWSKINLIYCINEDWLEKVSFRVGVTPELKMTFDEEALELLLVCFVPLGIKTIAFAATCSVRLEASIYFDEMNLYNLISREIEVIDVNRATLDHFTDQVKRDTGLDFVLILGSPYSSEVEAGSI